MPEISFHLEIVAFSIKLSDVVVEGERAGLGEAPNQAIAVLQKKAFANYWANHDFISQFTEDCLTKINYYLT